MTTFKVYAETLADGADEAESTGLQYSGPSLRDAIAALFGGDGFDVEFIQPSAYPERDSRWLTVGRSMDDYGVRESRSLHWPDSTSGASVARIIKAARDW